MAFEEFKLDRKVKKAEKKIAKKEKYANKMKESDDKLTDLTHRVEDAHEKITTEEWYSNHLERSRIDLEIREARQNLFYQRQRLLRRLIMFNKEYKYILTKPDTAIKMRELQRCSTGAKNAAYALAVVDNAIDRLDSIRSELEWREIMRDLTKGYKMLNAISVGSDLMTRLAFLLQKARHDIKGDISIEAMEYYYGKPIDILLEEQTGEANAADMLVQNAVLDLDDEDAVLNAIRWGSVFTVQPGVAANVASQQSEKASRTGSTPIYTRPDETFNEVKDFSATMDATDLPDML